MGLIREDGRGRGYVAAVSLTAIVFLLRLWVDNFLGTKVVFLPYLLVIIGASALGGLGPGIFATFLALVAGGYFILVSNQSTAPLDYSQFVLIAFIGLLISLIGENFHKAMRKVSAQSRDLDYIKSRLEATEQSRLLTLEAGRMGTWEWFMEDNKVVWTPSMGVVFGLDEKSFPKTFEDYLALVHDEDRERVRSNLERTFESGSPTFEGRYRIRLNSGSERWIATRGQSVKDGNQVIGLRGVCWDISEEVEASISQARLATIVGSTDDGIVSKNLEGIVLTWNSGAQSIFGYTEEEMVGESILKLLPEDRQDEEAEILRSIRAGNSIKNLETIRKRKDGHLITVSATISPIFDADGRIVAVSKFVRDITHARALEEAQQKAQNEVVERERRLSLATDTAELGIMEWNLETGDVRWENDQMYTMFGRNPELGPYSYDEFLEQIVIPEERERLKSEVATALQNSNSVNFRFQIRRAIDGVTRTLHSQGSLIRSDDGQPVKLVAVLSDITDKLTAEEQLEIVLSRIDDHLVSYDTDWRYIYANDGACKAVGKTRDELIGKCIWDLFPQAVGNKYYQELHRALKNQESIRSEHYYEPFDRWFENHIYPSRRGVTVFASDITDRKKAEVALSASRELLAAQEEQLQHLIDSIPVLISFVDAQGNYRLANKQYEVWFGTPATEIVGRHMSQVLGEDAFKKIEPYVEKVLAGKESSYEMEIPYTTAGKKFVRANYIPNTDSKGDLNGFFVLVADHTELNQRELDAKFMANASSTLATMVDYRATLRKIADLAVPYFADWCSIDILDDNGKLERLAVAHDDPAKVRLAQELHEKYPPSLAEEQGIAKVIRTGESEIVSTITDEVIDVSINDPEVKKIVKDLGLHSYICVPLTVKGKPIGAMMFVSAEMKRTYDHGDLANAEDLARRASVSIENALLYQQLQDTDRRKDEFLATLAHELRNPLAPLRTGIDILARSKDKPEVIADVQGVMERQLKQMVRLVDDLMDISRITTGKLDLRAETVYVQDLLKGAIEANRSLIDQRSHSLMVNVLGTVPPVYVDPARITQVLQNLVNNAAKYTDPGGTIQVSVSADGPMAVVSVKDNGIGIDADHIDGIFGMFSQVEAALNRSHGGLGIGLSLVKGIVEMHEGRVEVKSAGIGKGSEFIVRLPSIEMDGENRGSQSLEQESGSKKVLVVDDNVDISSMLGKMLSLVGNEVMTANTGEEALSHFSTFNPDAVLLDIGMPGMNGYEVARRIRQLPRGSEVKLVALTGWGSDEDKRQTKEAGFDHHLVKPVQLSDLEKVLF